MNQKYINKSMLKGAERKLRDEDKRAQKRKLAGIHRWVVRS